MGELKIVFSTHAREQLVDRRIPAEWVELTISAPLKAVVHGRKFFAYRAFGRLYLKVVFVRDKEQTVVVTQHFVKKLPL
jgi:hypothetical protein